MPMPRSPWSRRKKPAQAPGHSNPVGGGSVFLEERRIYRSKFRLSTLILIFAYLYFGTHIVVYLFSEYAYL